VGLPNALDTLTYEVEGGYWAAALHGAAWVCRVLRSGGTFELEACEMSWVS
jgi:hypothetical protein